nr:hypothetical protein [Tanacetum cinerariifolium]
MANKTVGIGVGPVYNKDQVNHQNLFVPQSVLLRIGKVHIPPVRPQLVPTGKIKVSTPVSTGKPKVSTPFPIGKPKVSKPVPTGKLKVSTLVLLNQSKVVYEVGHKINVSLIRFGYMIPN